MMGWQWHQLNHMQAICTLLQKITTPAWARCPSWHPTNSIKALKANYQHNTSILLSIWGVQHRWQSGLSETVVLRMLVAWPSSLPGDSCNERSVCCWCHDASLFVGLTIAEKWNTDGNLGSEINVEDQLVSGLKLSFEALFAPQTGYWCCELLCSVSSIRPHHKHSIRRSLLLQL